VRLPTRWDLRTETRKELVKEWLQLQGSKLGRSTHAISGWSRDLGTKWVNRGRRKGAAGVHGNELLARREVKLASQGDIEGLRRLYAEGCVFHYPGKNPLAGAHRGLSAFLTRLDEVFNGATITRELHDALGTDDHAVQLIRATATARGRSHTWRVVWVMNVRNGQFCEAWAHFDDQYALDSFLNAIAGLQPRDTT
jgi:ketosteroid isomerase-like protein